MLKPKTNSGRIQLAISVLVLVGATLLLIMLNNQHTDQSPPPTIASAVVTPASMPATPFPTEEPGKDDGGGVIRTIRKTPGAVVGAVKAGGGWVLDGGKWAWGQLSSGGETIWQAIRGSADFLWKRVTNLPGFAWEQIVRLGYWVTGTKLGIAFGNIQLPDSSNLNPNNWLAKMNSWLLRLLLQLVIAAALISLIYSFFRWRLWKSVDRKVQSGARKLTSYNEME